jgi:hypothetical protein
LIWPVLYFFTIFQAMATVVQPHRRELQREHRERGRREVREADPQALRRPKQVLRRAAADTDARD